MVNMTDLPCLRLINKRNKDLLQFKGAQGKPEQFNKGCTGARNAIIDDLIAFLQAP